MKKYLFKILSVVILITSLILASCGNNPTANSIKIGNLEVAHDDLWVNMNWEDAKKSCIDLGEGWRLPSKEELIILYENKDKIGGFADSYSNKYGYWSSTEGENNEAWIAAFFWGREDGFGSKNLRCNVRAVRSISN